MPFIVLLFLTLSVFVGIPSASAQDWGCGGPV